MLALNRFALAATVLVEFATAELAAYQNAQILENSCLATASEAGDLIQCNFSGYYDTALARVYTKITAGSCSDVANVVFTTSETTSSDGATGFKTDSLSISVTDAEKNCEAEGTSSGVNSSGKSFCTVTKAACARADLVDLVEGVSVKAAMMDATITYKYAQDGTFDVFVDTASFDPSNVSSAASRTVTIQVFKGACGTTSACELTGANGATCYDADPLEIGTTMDLCIVPEDSDVKVVGIQSVTVTPTGDGAEVTTVVDAAGAVNFVTAVNVDSVTRGATLSSLMIPLYYDDQLGAAGSISIAGNAILEYIDILPTRRLEVSFDRLLQSIDKEIPFSIIVPLNRKENPAFASEDIIGSGANAAVVGWTSLALGCSLGIVFRYRRLL